MTSMPRAAPAVLLLSAAFLAGCTGGNGEVETADSVSFEQAMSSNCALYEDPAHRFPSDVHLKLAQPCQPYEAAVGPQDVHFVLFESNQRTPEKQATVTFQFDGDATATTPEHQKNGVYRTQVTIPAAGEFTAMVRVALPDETFFEYEVPFEAA